MEPPSHLSVLTSGEALWKNITTHDSTLIEREFIGYICAKEKVMTQNGETNHALRASLALLEAQT